MAFWCKLLRACLMLHFWDRLGLKTFNLLTLYCDIPSLLWVLRQSVHVVVKIVNVEHCPARVIHLRSTSLFGVIPPQGPTVLPTMKREMKHVSLTEHPVLMSKPSGLHIAIVPVIVQSVSRCREGGESCQN